MAEKKVRPADNQRKNMGGPKLKMLLFVQT